MPGDATRKPFRAVLAELAQVHEHELTSLQVRYEERLHELLYENEALRSHLNEATGRNASLDPSPRVQGTETVVAQCDDDADAGESAEVGAIPVPGPRAPPGAAPGAPPPAASLAAPAKGPPTATPEDPTLVGAGPTAADPQPEAGAQGGTHEGLRLDESLCYQRWFWEVIGGEGKGGIVVREGQSTSSPQLAARLSTGAMVEEIELNGDRLHFKRLAGVGPDEGWISIKWHGRELAVRACQTPERSRQPPPLAVGPNGEEPLPVAILFKDDWGAPAEGVLGNFRDLPAMKEMIRRASPILGPEYLTEPQNVVTALRPAVLAFISGLASLERFKGLRPEVVRRASAMAGTGLGQSMALCAAGVLSFEDALKLVVLRAKAIIRSTRLGAGRIVSVSGLGQERLEQICHEVQEMEGRDSVCEIAIYLNRRVFFVGGTAKATERVREMAQKVSTRVEVRPERMYAAHTALMEPVHAEIAAALDEALPSMKPPLHTIWLNTTGEPVRPSCSPADIVHDIKAELMVPQQLSRVADGLRTDGISEFYVVGPTVTRCASFKPSCPAEWAELWTRNP